MGSTAGRRGSSRRRSRCRAVEPIRERHEGGLALTCDDDAVQLDSRRRTPRASASSVGDSAMASGRSRSSSSRLSMRKTARWPPESTGLSTAGRPTASSAASTSPAERRLANGGCGRPLAPSACAHGALVREEVGGLRADPREAELLCNGRDDGYGAIGRDRECAVGTDPARDLDDLGDVGEVDDLGDVGGRRGPAPRHSGRPRRRAGRALEPARSRDAGGVPRRRRGRSARPPMLTAVWAGQVTPPGGTSHGEIRLQRSISHPFVRVNVAQISLARHRADDARLLRAAVDLRADDVLPQRREQLRAARGESPAGAGRTRERPAWRVAAKRPGDVRRRPCRVLPVRDPE